MRFATPLFAALLAAYAATATAQTPITLDQAMANPDWIGTPVDAAWWGWDSHQVYYSQKRLGAALHDTYAIAGGPAKLVGDAQLANADAANMVYNRDHTRAIVLRNGDMFERDLKNGALVQIVRGRSAIRGRRRPCAIPRRQRLVQLEPRRAPGVAGGPAAHGQGPGRRARGRQPARHAAAPDEHAGARQRRARRQARAEQ